MTVIPLLLLAGLELALRIAGYGYPTAFFLKSRIEGREVLIENEKFAWLFFPPHLARRPLSLAIDAQKPASTYRIFVLGESAAMGDPDPAFGFSRILQVLLEQRLPGTRFEVVNVAFTAINSHVILPLARDCARHDGDLWIVYLGNNEVEGPFGAGTVFGPQAPGLGFIRASVALKTTKVGQWLDALQRKFKGDSSTPKSWSGMEMFLEHPVRQNDPRLQVVYENFQKNLEDILQAGRKAGAKIIVSTVASNLKDCAPLLSLPATRLAGNEKSAWERAYQAGAARESEGKFADAIKDYLEAAKIDDQFPDLHFRLGRCDLALTNFAQARRGFEQARDLDALRFRADSRLNEIIKATAARFGGDGVYFLDAREPLARDSSAGIPGQEFFYDHVHLNFEGNYRLARAFAEETARLLPASITQSSTASWASAYQCARRLALTGWNRYQMGQSMLGRLSKAPFTNQLNHAARVQAYAEKLSELRPFTEPAALKQAAEIYREALTNAPADPVLHESFAKLLYAQGDLDGALKQFEQVTKLWPQAPASFYNLGHILESQGKTNEAQKYFAEALRLRPDFAEALNGFGGILAREGKAADAMPYFERALRTNPDFAEARINIGLAWQQLGNASNAVASFTEVLRNAPNSISAHTNLANILVAQGKLFDAMPHYSEAVRLQPALIGQFIAAAQAHPQDPLAYFNLANALAVQKRRSETIQTLQAAVGLKPDFWEARYLLGVELAQDNKIPEAEVQFSEVVRLRPDFALAHLNLGVALVQEKRYVEALDQFRETLRLDPTNKLAKQHLNTLESALVPRN